MIEKLFSHAICSNHCLYHLLALDPDRSSLDMSLRPRGHSLNVPPYRYKYDLTRKSFTFRSLYNYR